MHTARTAAACVVLEGRIVVTGGYDNLYSNPKAVEAYDHVTDKWKYMPNMIRGRHRHKSVAIKNKLFLIGGTTPTCEVYDSTLNKFVLLKAPPEYYKDYLCGPAEFISIGRKLVLISNDRHILFYNFENDEWLEKSFEVTKNIMEFCCANVALI